MQIDPAIRKKFLAERFGGKKITLMGLGLLGRGLGDAKFLAAQGADLIITDLKTEAELAPSVAALAQFPNITFRLGGHQLKDFEKRDLVIKAPNTPLDSPFIAHAHAHKVPVEMDAAFFTKLATELAAQLNAPAPTIVGITGTRGKSTTAYLIYATAQAAANAGTIGPVYLGGNMKDIATLPFIEIVNPGDVIILELDSWQLQGFAEDGISPHIAVWTNFMPDHMNYYHGDMERYFEDKAAIARFQKPGDIFIAPPDITATIEKRFGTLAGSPSIPSLPADWEIALPGEHNRANAACAVAAARGIGIPDEIIKKVLKTFTGLPGRLERLGEKNRVLFYNDSNATTPQATIAALRALAEMAATKDRPIILIAGGSDKELDFSELAKTIMADKKLKKLILFAGKASHKLKALLPEDFSAAAATMDEAMQAALSAAVPGDIILLSPGATSFGIFKNEYDRGDQFAAAFANIATTG